MSSSVESSKYNIFRLIMWLNHSLTYAAEEEQNADGEELLTHVLSYTHELYICQALEELSEEYQHEYSMC